MSKESKMPALMRGGVTCVLINSFLLAGAGTRIALYLEQEHKEDVEALDYSDDLKAKRTSKFN